MDLNRENVIEPWKVHKLPKSLSFSGTPWYIGPKHGRLIVCDYATKEEADAAVETKNWVVKYLKVKK